MKKKTHDEYVNELLIKNSNVEVVDKYIDANTPIYHKCIIHDTIWKMSPSNALKGQGCQLCRVERIKNKTRKTHDDYVVEVAIKNPDVEVLGQYVNSTTKILHKCKLCGREWLVVPYDILSGKGCRDCGIKRTSNANRKTHEQYMQDLYVINKNIVVVENYINTDTPILHRCKICGYEWSIKPNHTLSGHGCPICASKRNADLKRKSHEEYVQELFSINPNIEPLETYISNPTAIMHRCKTCGYEWKIDPNHTLRGQGCPECNESHGEKEIAQWLQSNNILYIPQYKFNNCRNKHPLPFDFYLPQHNMCIEYDGKQHFEPIEWFGGVENFRNQQQIDEIKNDYCKNNHIDLLRITYKNNVKEELEKVLLI